jgi:hypothetical protein
MVIIRSIMFISEMIRMTGKLSKLTEHLVRSRSRATYSFFAMEHLW